MKIAFFTKQLPSDEPNGVSVQVHRLAEALTSLGHHVVCFSFSPKPAGAKYEHCLLQWGGGGAVYKKFAPGLMFRKIDTEGFDILHYHGDDYLCTGAHNRVRTFYGSALFEAIHSSKVKRFLYQSLFYVFELASCMRKGTKVGISQNTCRVLPFVRTDIPCSVPLGLYAPGKRKSETPSILFVGGINNRKRGHLVLEAFQREILPVHPDCVLYVVGPENCSGTNVIYEGKLTQIELVSLFQKCWVYCMTSSYEGFGVPAIEAMACGSSVVAVRNPGVLEIIRDKVNGMLCSDHDFGRKVNEVIADRGLRSTLVHNGLEAVKRYDSEKVAREYEKVYFEILKS
ncbi:MAG: glycosyltransferase family 4 protein [Chitinispirillaceae bacterium]